MDQRTKRTLWIAGGAVVLVALVRSHHISTDEVLLFIVIIPSIILHEISHGYVARLFGDHTAERAGRLTLNPIVHVDPLGTLIVPGLLALASMGLFGWAKPVPVNVGNLRSPRNQGVLVSLAGPATNVLLAVASGVVFIAFFRTAFNETDTPSLVARLILLFSVVNVGLTVFNMIPLPPLDGSVLFERVLPARYWPTYLRIRPYTMPVLMILVLISINIHWGPLTNAFANLYNWWLGVLGVTSVRF
jgi:Zn-dependent protease